MNATNNFVESEYIFLTWQRNVKIKKKNYSTYFYELSRLSEKATVMLKKDNCVQLSIAFVKEFRYIQIQLKIS